MATACCNPDCSNAIHSFKFRLGNSGSWKRYGNRWFCSHRCFFALRATEFIQAHRTGIKRTIRRVKLGLLLLKNNLIDKETLEQALADQSVTSMKLGDILTGAGKITDRDLRSALSMQAGVAQVSLEPGTKVKLKNDIPLRLLREYPFVCFRFDSEESSIGIALYDLDFLVVLEELFLEIYPGCSIKFYLENKDKILGVLANNYSGETFGAPPPAQATTTKTGTPEDDARYHEERLLYKLVEFLTHSGAHDLDVDHRNGTTTIKTTLDNIDINIELKKPPG